MASPRILAACKRAGLVSLLIAAVEMGLVAQTVTFNTLVKFDGTVSPMGGWDSGNSNLTSLVQGKDGNLYGTTEFGGSGNFGFNCSGGAGTAFRMTPGGSFSTLQVFHTCPNSPEGVFPKSGLVLATNGNLFGTTQQGGNNSPVPHDGTVFTITPGGTLTTLFNFPNDFNNPPTTDGSQPVATLVQGTDGNFYGTTTTGGANKCGTIFKITATGTLTALFSFPFVSNCDLPYGTLIQGNDGNFYGTTRNGGTHNAGTIYRFNPSTHVFSIFYNFKGSCGASCSTGPYDGQQPNGGLVQGSDGSFYGTTEGGGTESSGTVFKITAGGSETVLHSFGGAAFPSYFLDAPLIQATDGNLYGTATRGGDNSCFDGCGQIFRISPTGVLTLLHSFSGADGANPTGGLVQYTDGSFYGITGAGGNQHAGCNSTGCGTIYHFSIGLPPFVKLVPTSGKVGSQVTILGNKLTGTTNVKFNGTAASPTGITSTAITVTVPAGATTGNVQVVTPSGTLSSNVKFRVSPTISSFSPASGAVGTTVVINGGSFTGATGVTIGGVKAAFAVNSYTKITATVPTGAKTGKVSVTTPGGSAISTGTFTVTP